MRAGLPNQLLLISFSTTDRHLYLTFLLTIGFTFCRMTSCWRSCHRQEIPMQFSPIFRNALTPLQSRLITSFFLDKCMTRLSLSCCSKSASQMFSFIIIQKEYKEMRSVIGIYYLLTESEVFTRKFQTSALSLGLRFPCNDRTLRLKLLIVWPFRYGPEPAIN